LAVGVRRRRHALRHGARDRRQLRRGPAPPPTIVGPRPDDRALIVGRAAADDAGTRLGRGRAVAAVHLVIPVVGIGATAGIEERRGPPTRRPRAAARAPTPTPAWGSRSRP